MNHRANGAIPRAATRALDRIDRLILKRLQADGRKSVAELAREVHLTTSPCLDRVRRLEDDGFIQGYAALLNPESLGARLLAFVGVRLDSTAPEVVRSFRTRIESMEEVVECHRVGGGFDYVIKVRVPDMQAYSKFLSERLETIPCVTQTSTFVALEEVKSTLSFQF